MRFPYANLSAVDFTERAGNNGESVLEQLFDKLFITNDVLPIRLGEADKLVWKEEGSRVTKTFVAE